MPFVYFIHEEGIDNCFKIGKTENHPADRMEQLQTGNPRKLIIYRWIKINDHSTAEEFLHIVFHDVHIRGEWYHVTRDQIDAECDLISANDPQVSISGKWEQYTASDRLKVKEERVARGKYRGKRPPREAAARREGFIENQQINRLLNM